MALINYGLSGGVQKGKKPLLPADFSADADSDTAITLTWVEGTTAPNSIQIDYSLDETLWAPLVELEPGIETYTQIELDPDTQYFYRLRVRKGNFWSNYVTDDETTDAE